MKSISKLWDKSLTLFNPVTHFRKYWHRHGTSQKIITVHEMACFIIMLVVSFYSLLGPWLISFPSDLHVVNPQEVVFPFESYNHLLGTDIYGRDLLDVFLLGINKSFLISLVVVLIVALLVMPLAIIMGYYIGKNSFISKLSAPLIMFVPLFYYFVLSALFGPTIFIAGMSVLLHAMILSYYALYRDVVQIMTKSLVKNLMLDGATFKHIVRLVLLPLLMPNIFRILRRTLILVVTELILIGVLQLGINPTSVYWGNVIYQAWVHRDMNPYTLFVVTALVSVILYAAFVSFRVAERLVTERIDLMQHGKRQKRQEQFIAQSTSNL
ncbi:hypothetical protein [Psittacicella hinzii]|uniref:ABC transmembrane type-1 domain-containing protein n=1 Tax=Psittacicella hinzii TaxID=2028575 RepID=A0A3A1YUM6_9GAMM|nr:hypothetical protein [Psittacicella hinzii]RIY40144.1 hypothetical protein CKF58_01010 [Psittacicella hinzii]